MLSTPPTRVLPFPPCLPHSLPPSLSPPRSVPSLQRAPTETQCFNGYLGFDNENIRVENLAGRRFTAYDNEQRWNQFFRTNIDLGTMHDIPARHAPGLTVSQSLGRTKATHTNGPFPPGHHPVDRAGRTSNYGKGENPFDLITGDSRRGPHHWELGPVFGAYSKRLPVHLLPTKQRVSSLSASGRLATARTAGAPDYTDRNYLDVNTALHHTYNDPGTTRGPFMGRPYTSHAMLKEDRNAKRYASMGVSDEAGRPLASSGAYGSFYAKDRNAGVSSPLGKTMRHTGPLAEDPKGLIGAKGGAVYRPRVLFPETRTVESGLVQHRGSHGYK